MRALIPTVTALAVALALAPLAAADPPFTPPGHAKKMFAEPRGHGPGYGERKAKHRRFSSYDDIIVRSYFSGQPRPWTSLPPGIAKNYARGKPLPPGIAKKYLPLSLEGDLPARPGMRYYLVGRDVVLVDTTTRIVIDILRDVFR
jgi:hypothetical protein